VTRDIVAFARGIPKAELHVHLEGTISPSAYRRIAARNAVDAPDAEDYFDCHDFPTFLNAFLRVVKVLRRPVDFAEIAEEYIARSAADGVRHIEFFISPATQRKFVPALDLDEMLRAVTDASARATTGAGMTYGLILDMVRNLGEEEAMKDIELALRFRERGLVGVGLGGDERHFPARDYAKAFARAKARGLRRTVHAGEAAGPESIIDAVTLLGAERIGHGVAASGRVDVLALLRTRGVAIDACPTSNRITGALTHGTQHPLREFLDAGVIVTLNSDDPAFFGASIGDEYANAASSGFGADRIAAIARNGFAASFLPDADKARRIDEVDAYCVETGITR
jgi:adenosine deaminase